jgi:hypothetical protein
MKRLTLTVFILSIIGVVGYAGSERISSKDKEVMQPAPPPCDWYRAHEWDLMLWGTYAFAANSGSDDHFALGVLEDDKRINNFGGSKEDQRDQDVGMINDDKFLNRDDAWGGGVDVKYFFSKYWALGAEGFIVDAKSNSAGAGLFTFTFRYPIGCSRFAPYAWAGVGAAAGGGKTIAVFSDIHTASEESFGDEEDRETLGRRTVSNNNTEAIGQFGGGLEIRVTRRIGFMSDFAWNVVSGPQNDFGMVRAGLTLSY